MEFIRKNLITVLVVGATVVLAGVAVFTAMRLYQLRDTGVTPVEPNRSSADESPVGVRPSSGNWDLPENFVVTNTSNESVEVVWQLDCWDETVCDDEQGTTALAPGESFEEGLGVICSQWQLDINYSGTVTEARDTWDFASVSQIDPECDFDLANAEATDSADLVEEESLAALPTEQVSESASNFETTQCTVLAFTTDNTGTGGTVITPSPSATARASATPAVSATPTPLASVTPTAQPELPDAGIGMPTIMGIGIGALLLVAAMALAI